MVAFKSSLLILASLVAGSLSQSIATVTSDLNAISSQVTTLDKAITAFPTSGASLVAALGINSDSSALVTSINQATTDVKAVPTPVSEADGNSILTLVEGFEPTIIHALQEIITKKSGFTSLPIGGLAAVVLSDLKSLNTSTSAFEAALISSAPADLKAQATTIKSAIDAAFSAAIAAYS